MKIVLFSLLALTLSQISYAEAPHYQNDCAKLIKPNQSDLKNAKIKNSFVISKTPLICHMFFITENQHQNSLFVIRNKKAINIFTTKAHEFGECSGENIVLKPTLIKIQNEKQADDVIAIEEVNSVAGCCGAAAKTNSNLYLYNLRSQKLSSALPASDYCEPDQSCGGKCEGKFRNLEVRFDFDRCETEPCNQIHFTKRSFGSKKKPDQFVLKWDKYLKLTEAAY